jgi:hypothetical protein
MRRGTTIVVLMLLGLIAAAGIVFMFQLISIN